MHQGLFLKVVSVAQGSVAACLLLCGLQVFAQNATDLQQALESANRQRQFEAQRLQQQLQQDRASAAPPTQLTVPTITPPQVENSICRDITRIDAQGIALLSPRQVQQVVAHYTGRCLGVKDIESLLSDITRVYVERGWIAVRAYLPAQDLSTGVLKVLVVEGQVADVRIDDGDQASIALGNVAPGVVGKPLNLRDIEQALDQINRLASNRATVEMVPGAAPGDTVVVLYNQPKSRWHAGWSVDTHGSASTGENQTALTLSVDNLLGFNDFLSYSKRHSLPLNRREQMSQSDTLSYILPWGYSTLSLNASVSDYQSSFTAASGNRLSNSGNSQSYGLRLDHVFYRNARTIWTAYGNLTAKASESYLENVLLEAASRKLTVVDAGVSVNTVLAGGMFASEWGVSQGTRLLGALRDAPNVQSSDPRAQFRKWTYSGRYVRPLQVIDRSLEWSSQWSGQYAQNVLYGSEQIMIGSLYSVRGFTAQSLSGDHGFYVRNEIALRQTHEYAGQPMHLRYWLGIDYGRISSRNDGAPEGALTGMAAGLQMNTGHGWSAELFSTKGLHHPQAMNNEPVKTWLRLAWAM